MKVWTAPEIYVLAAPSVNFSIVHEWRGIPGLSDMLTQDSYSDSDDLAEIAGRACYWSYGKGRKTNEAYIKNIIDSGHGSVLEHPHWTFGLRGISRALSHELVRHRHLSFSQLSQRYVNEEPEFVKPPALTDSDAIRLFEDGCKRSADDYAALLKLLPDNKQGREAARAVLPNACATRVVCTGNARALRQMLSLRGSAHADAEFRRLAVHWTTIMKELAPNTFADFSVQDGVVITENPKV